MPNHARTHEENQKIVCLICLKKCSRQLTAFMWEQISKIYGVSFDKADSHIPQGICEACRTMMRRKGEGQDITLPPLFDFTTISVRTETRGHVCDCLLYKTGRLQMNEKHPLDETKAEEKNTPLRCNDCLSPIGKGLAHTCNQFTFRENLKGLAARDAMAAEQIAATVITNKEASPHGTVRLSKASGGHAFPITPGPSGASSKPASSFLTTQDLVNVQLNTGLSNVGIKRLVSTVNQASVGKLVEPNFASKFLAVGQQLSEFFTHTQIKGSSTKGDSRDFTVAHCKSLSDLLNRVLTSRNISSEPLVKLGIDGGKGFMKFCLTIVEKSSAVNKESRSSPAKRSLTQRVAKDTGVKRQMLLAVVEEFPETYESVHQVWALVGCDAVNLFIACDLKLANILCGLQAHSSSHPCAWCDIDANNLENAGTFRTLGSLRKSFESFRRSGGVHAKAKLTGNVIHYPIINGPNDKLILDIIPPPELHLLLGVVNLLYKMLKGVWPEAEAWPSSLNIAQSPYHGGQFEGNECRKLLKNVDRLQQLAEANSAFQVLGFVDTLRKFDSVVRACFGSELSFDYFEKIQQFKTSFLALPNCHITPKLHVVFHHISDFIDRQNSSLGRFSEQAVEAAHQDFGQHWQRFKRSITHPDYPEKLTNCLVDYNSKHL